MLPSQEELQLTTEQQDLGKPTPLMLAGPAPSIIGANPETATLPPVVTVTTYKNYTPALPACHTGNIAILQGEQSALYLGGWSRHAKEEQGWAIIDLTGSTYNAVYATGDKFLGFMAAYQSQRTPDDTLALYIKDFGVPVYTPQEILALADDVLAMFAAGQNILMACTGGHGRTGTMAAVLVPLCIDDPQIMQPNPIEWIRQEYCHEAVETSEQVAWVKKTLEELGFTDYTWDPMPKPAKVPFVATRSPALSPGYQWQQMYGDEFSATKDTDITRAAREKYGLIVGDWVKEGAGIKRCTLVGKNGYYLGDGILRLWPRDGLVEIAQYVEEAELIQAGKKKKKQKKGTADTEYFNLPFDEDDYTYQDTDDLMADCNTATGLEIIGRTLWPTHCESCGKQTNDLHLIKVSEGVSLLTQHSFESKALISELGSVQSIICGGCADKLASIFRFDIVCLCCGETVSTLEVGPSVLSKVICDECNDYVTEMLEAGQALSDAQDKAMAEREADIANLGGV